MSQKNELEISVKALLKSLPSYVKYGTGILLFSCIIFVPACNRTAPDIHGLIAKYTQEKSKRIYQSTLNDAEIYANNPEDIAVKLKTYLDYPIPYEYVEYHQINNHLVPGHLVDSSPKTLYGAPIKRTSILRDSHGNISPEFKRKDGTFTPGYMPDVDQMPTIEVPTASIRSLTVIDSIRGDGHHGHKH